MIDETSRLTRRAFSGTALAAFAKPSQPTTPVNFQVPPHACDCHTHIFGDPAKFPLHPSRSYTPEVADPAAMAALHKALGIERVVIVTPSVYGTDNSATLYGLAARGKTARGIAVIDDQTSERDLNIMHKAGVRGIRLNLTTAGISDPAVGRQRFQTAVARMKARGWHIQMFASPAIISGIKDLVLASPVPVVFDHFGGAVASKGMEKPGFADLVDLVYSGKAYVKISVSGPNLAPDLRPVFSVLEPMAKALIAANPNRVLWGTDWPHPRPGTEGTQQSPFHAVDDGVMLNQLPAWAPSADLRSKILSANPARLYDF